MRTVKQQETTKIPTKQWDRAEQWTKQREEGRQHEGDTRVARTLFSTLLLLSLAPGRLWRVR